MPDWLLPLATGILGGGGLASIATALKYRRDAARSDLKEAMAALVEALGQVRQLMADQAVAREQLRALEETERDCQRRLAALEAVHA